MLGADQPRRQRMPFLEHEAGCENVFSRLVKNVAFKMSINKHLDAHAGAAKIGKLAELANKLYEDRRLVIFVLIHFIATMVIWGHFFYNKFRVQEAKVPLKAPHYWGKRMIPPLEFGSMHAILFQMALIPLTMCRYTLAQLSSTKLRRYVPFNKITAMHIHLGYTMILIVFLASVVFFAFFGSMCQAQKDGTEPSPLGVHTFCQKFESEIMATGLAILGCLLIVFFTSFFRHRIPYEVFYIVHHVVFFMFILAIAHTVDVQQRSGKKDRSQVWKWCSASLLYYATDRLFMYMANCRALRVTEITALESAPGEKSGRVVILRLHKPPTLDFVAGQFCKLHVPAIDASWHPFSIASDPAHETLDFYIEVYDSGGSTKLSWTQQLWDVANEYGEGTDPKHRPPPLKVEMYGALGSGLSDCRDFSSMIAVGSGTGIVPIISHFRNNIANLLRMDPTSFNLAKHARRARAHAEQQRRAGSVTIAQVLCKRLFSRDLPPPVSPAAQSTADEILHAETATYIQAVFRKHSLERHGSQSSVFRSAVAGRGSVLQKALCGLARPLLAVFQVTLLALMFSFSNQEWQPTDGMHDCLRYGSAVALALFGLASFGNKAAEIASYLDFIVTAVGFIALHWRFETKWMLAAQAVTTTITTETGITTVATNLKAWSGGLGAWEQFVFAAIFTYMIYRTWSAAVMGLEPPSDPTTSLDHFKFVWVSRSAALVTKLWPELERSFEQLQGAWGVDKAARVVSVEVYCTERDEAEKKKLEAATYDSALGRSGALKMRRPAFDDMLRAHVGRQGFAEVVDGFKCATQTIVAYCGSPQLGSHILKAVTRTGLLNKLTRQGHHEVAFEQEQYGAPAPAPKAKKNQKQKQNQKQAGTKITPSA
jgi:predicted ferric reductase